MSKPSVDNICAVRRITSLTSNAVAWWLCAEQSKQWVEIVDLAACVFADTAVFWVDGCLSYRENVSERSMGFGSTDSLIMQFKTAGVKS